MRAIPRGPPGPQAVFILGLLARGRTRAPPHPPSPALPPSLPDRLSSASQRGLPQPPLLLPLRPILGASPAGLIRRGRNAAPCRAGLSRGSVWQCLAVAPVVSIPRRHLGTWAPGVAFWRKGDSWSRLGRAGLVGPGWKDRPVLAHTVRGLVLGQSVFRKVPGSPHRVACRLESSSLGRGGRGVSGTGETGTTAYFRTLPGKQSRRWQPAVRGSPKPLKAPSRGRASRSSGRRMLWLTAGARKLWPSLGEAARCPVGVREHCGLVPAKGSAETWAVGGPLHQPPKAHNRLGHKQSSGEHGPRMGVRGIPAPSRPARGPSLSAAPFPGCARCL